MEKYGFVYIWFDRKHKRYYVGSHWGTEDDGYICSSSWMKRAYKLRHQDFRRRIIARVTTSRQDLLLEENRWLQMIDDDELGSRFYNLTKHLNGHWSSDQEKRSSVGNEISRSLNSPESKRRISESIRRTWLDPEVRKKRITNRLRTINSDPTHKERHSKATSDALSTPEMKEKSSRVAKALWEDESFRIMKKKEITDRWADSESRKRLTDGMKMAWTDPEICEKRKQSMRGKKKTPVSREILDQRIATRKANGWNKRNRKETHDKTC